MNTPSISVITGQTATGKTALAVETAKRINGEIISADSRQVYRGMDIITGKDLDSHDFHEVRRHGSHRVGYYLIDSVPVWLLDIVAPSEHFSSHEYARHAIPCIRDILNRGKTPILTGGTYLYLYHVLYGLDGPEVGPDEDLRAELSGLTIEALQERLRVLDPGLFDSLNDSDRNNPHRLIRKIELAGRGGRAGALRFDFTIGERLGITGVSIEMTGLRYASRERLRQAIEQRVDKRVAAGAKAEVKTLLDAYAADAPGMKTIGYDQMIRAVLGTLTHEQAVSEWITKEMQYAKRQLTFMKRDPHIIWHDIP